jgi:hypothetical protein
LAIHKQIILFKIFKLSYPGLTSHVWSSGQYI